MANNARKRVTIRSRQQQEKEALLKELQLKPNVEYACAKVGIGRATYYRWLKEDRGFARAVVRALKDSRARMNDIAEAVIIGKVMDKDVGASKYWLGHNHPRYKGQGKKQRGLKSEKAIIESWEEKRSRKALEQIGRDIRRIAERKQREAQERRARKKGKKK